MFRNAIVFILILVEACAFAQKEYPTEALVPDIAVRFSPAHLINFYPTVQFAFERRIGKKLTAQIDLGYVFQNKLETDDFGNMEGYKVKVEPRYYIIGGGKNRKRILYGALELYRNSVNFDRKDWRQECMDPECNIQYTRRYHYAVTYRENGFSLKCGIMRYIHNFFIDVNSGWGIRFIDYDHPALTPEFFADALFLDIPNETDRVALTPVLGIRLGYRFR